MVQLSHPYMTTGKTIALTRRTSVNKVMSLLLNLISRLVITFLPRSKCILISWLPSPSAVISEPKKIKSVTVSIVYPSTCHEVMGPGDMIFVFLRSEERRVGKEWKLCLALIFWAPKSLQMITAMKLKDAYSLGGKL